MELFGSHHANLTQIEQVLGVQALARGNEVTVTGPADAVEIACDALDGLYARLEMGLAVDMPEVDAAIRMSMAPCGDRASQDMVVHTRKRAISPRSSTQAVYLKAIDEAELVFGQGPAGTGKTYLAVAQAVAQLITGSVQRLILSRPAVEAGEKLGFLPGDLKEKVDPYLRPLYDALYDCMPPEQVERRLASGEIEIAPIAFMRGRTLADAFVILDEAQNTTREQMKMFLTRFGQNSRMVICGDPRQVDIPGGDGMSGLADAVGKLEGVDGFGTIRFTAADVVRHPIVGRIVEAYEGLNA